MCFFTQQTKKAVEIEFRYQAKFEDPFRFKPSEFINAYTFPATPVITNQEKKLIKHFNWGLIPGWANDENIKKYTLNARIETLQEKPSFRDYISNRCLIPANGFYEWQWLDPKGRFKQKYRITLPDEELFSFAGIWSVWNDPEDSPKYTYTLITTKANELMSKIHNTQKRMPVILSKEQEIEWLDGYNIKNFIETNPKLNACKIEQTGNKTGQQSLF